LAWDGAERGAIEPAVQIPYFMTDGDPAERENYLKRQGRMRSLWTGVQKGPR